jgi:hypothetical protein
MKDRNVIPAEVLAEMKKLLGANMAAGKYSAGLVNELAQRYLNQTLHVQKVLDEIGTLECIGRQQSVTNEATMLTGPFLDGIWHKRVTQPSDLPKNLRNYWSSASYSEALRTTHPSQLMDLMIGGYDARAGWTIIFAKHDGRNYYLTLGLHEDGASIWERCRACASQFPELAILRDIRPARP